MRIIPAYVGFAISRSRFNSHFVLTRRVECVFTVPLVQQLVFRSIACDRKVKRAWTILIVKTNPA